MVPDEIRCFGATKSEETSTLQVQVISQRILPQDWGIFVVNFVHIIRLKTFQRIFTVLNVSEKSITANLKDINSWLKFKRQFKIHIYNTQHI